MLALVNRLTKTRDFDTVKEKGEKLQSPSFALIYYKRNDSSPTRFGIIASTKVSKNATKRNYIRRAISESLRQNVSLMKPGYDVVFLVKSTADGKYMSDLMTEVVATSKKAGLYK